MLATLTLEREPLKFGDVPGMAESWLLAAGGIAAAALLIWLLASLLQWAGMSRSEAQWPRIQRLVAIGLLGLLAAILPNALRLLWFYLGWADLAAAPGGKTIGAMPMPERLQLLIRWNPLLLIAGCALAAAMLPMLLNLPHLSGRRIWALSKLSFKEAIRRRVLWAFSLLLLVFLFASWFFNYKPEDQLRTYVTTVYTTMTVLLLVTAGFLAAFSLPGDMRNQTIHTIVTKPVERFEIILGRFLGYTFLMTLVLAAMTLFSLVYVARGIDPDAAEESYKARVPVYGSELVVMGGKNVGYEWDYRQYISGDTRDDYATWTFGNIPLDFANRPDPSVRCEFTFDIFRTTKGVENEGVFCSFMFENWQCAEGSPGIPGVPLALIQYRGERTKLNGMLSSDAAGLARLLKLPPDAGAPTQLAIDNYLAEKYHFHEILSKEVVDFHTLFVDIPAGLFKNLKDWSLDKGPPLKVVVRCESRTQYLGVAPADLYLMDTVRGFEQNFFKGAVGLWYRLCLVIGVAVTCSTYLSGVIGFLATMVLYFLGLITDFIKQVAKHQALGGGPLEAAFRLARREHPTMPLDKNPILTVVQNLDKVSEWFFQGILYIIPDVDRFDMSRLVAEGFDVSGPDLLLTGLLLVGYLLPWGILAYYLMRAKEVAA